MIQRRTKSTNFRPISWILLPVRLQKSYRDRWQIETFVKALKQSLRERRFVGTSSNALKTQIWTALIAMKVLKYLKLKSKFD